MVTDSSMFLDEHANNEIVSGGGMKIGFPYWCDEESMTNKVQTDVCGWPRS